MKNFTIPILLILGFTLLTSCDEELFISSKSLEGSGDLIKIEKDISGVTKFELSHALEAEIIYGSNEYVTVWIDDNLSEYVIIEKVGSTLKVGLKDNNNYSDYTFKAEIVVPELRSIDASGAVATAIYGFLSSNNFYANISGACKLEGELTANNVDLILSGASAVSLEGNCINLKADASGASAIDFGNFESDNVDLNLSGASSALIYSNGTIEANLSGASILSYMGTAEIKSLTSSGVSIVRHINGP